MTESEFDPAERDSALIRLVDDEPDVRAALSLMLEIEGWRCVSYASAREFLVEDMDSPGCLVLDVRMPGMSGPELQERMIAENIDIPIVFITGHGDVPMAVSTMKRGAVDFIEKPFDESELRALVERMLQKARTDHSAAREQRAAKDLLAKLTTREQQVLERIVAGRLNKQIADDLGISIKTVEAHRANIMEKLNVNTVADLLRLALSRNA